MYLNDDDLHKSLKASRQQFILEINLYDLVNKLTHKQTLGRDSNPESRLSLKMSGFL